MAIMVRNAPRRCSAEGCVQPIPHERLMCDQHRAKIPQAIQDELRATYNAWKQGASRKPYLAARIKAIIAVAEMEGKTVSHAMRSILQAIETGEWTDGN